MKKDIGAIALFLFVIAVVFMVVAGCAILFSNSITDANRARCMAMAPVSKYPLKFQATGPFGGPDHCLAEVVPGTWVDAYSIQADPK
jgi:hypothetical protein